MGLGVIEGILYGVWDGIGKKVMNNIIGPCSILDYLAIKKVRIKILEGVKSCRPFIIVLQLAWNGRRGFGL